MKKYFSWKINDNDYAYLYIPGKKTHINQRITDVDIINQIIAKVSKWDETKFKTAFDSMNSEVYAQYGVTIPYTEKYFTGNQEENIIIMGASVSEEEKYDNLKNELLDVIDERFKGIKDYLDNFIKEMVNLTNKRTIDTINSSKEVYNNTVEELRKVKEEVETRFNKASKNLENAAQIIGLGNKGINAESFKDLFIQTNSNITKISELTTNIEKIKHQNNDLVTNVKNIEDKFELKVQKMADDITVNTENRIQELLINNK